ncbi:MAG TPA: alkaline phosphatase D family protein [Solirubrobacterales bacterium]|nr:alkaline phosphatase D family protein [Solirubrobacterales bacterium]
MSELAELVLGPVVRFVDPEEATVWVETDRPCEVQVLGASSSTFAVDGHHYALVRIGGLEPGSSHEYEVLLDGERRWPEPGSRLPPSTIRTPDSGGPIEVVFGSCRVALPHEPPFTLSKDEHALGREHDALRTLALEMISGTRPRWPDLLLMLGDQVYVDEGSPRVREWIRSRRDARVPPGEEVANFEEYTRLYRESWGEPVMRWLLSVVPTAMVIDDHDMHDDWLISREWIEEMRREPWWEEREISGLMSYWVYQHLGNLSPRELEENPEYREAREAEDSVPVLRRFARREARVPEGKRWSFCTDIGKVRVVVTDDRTGRVLDHDRRSIFDDEEWRWVEDHATGDFDHLLIGTTDPFLLGPGLHYVEAWNEAVCEGTWGGAAARLGERMRRALDFDHWAAFQFSFHRLVELLEEVGAGRRGRPPATIAVLSGDVHHAYVADVAFPRDARVTSHVFQAVCSPFRNALDSHERLGVRIGMSRPGGTIARGLARAAGVDDPGIRWRVVEGPYFDNQVATLTLDGRAASIRLERAVSGPDRPRLERLFERRLS